MSVYDEIIRWSQSRPLIVRDALRRIVLSQVITDKDIDELVLLTKKEKGDASIAISAVPISNEYVPSAVESRCIYPKLKQIKNPVNIAALHKKGGLHFLPTGLTVVYGENGAGKSSYSRILKKLCWSRNPQVELKKNLFLPTCEPQKVEFVIEIENRELSYCWDEGSVPHSVLNQIFVFDTGCSQIYINKENPTEYKPVGVDILENLIPLLNRVSQKITSEIENCTTQKVDLDLPLNNTSIAKWYSEIEIKSKNEIDEYIQFGNKDLERKKVLSNILHNSNTHNVIQDLENSKIRIANFLQKILLIEKLFSHSYKENLISLRTDLKEKERAYNLATNELNGINLINGFGTESWRLLWESAKKFAQSNSAGDEHHLTSLDSLDRCVLCQQNLSTEAKDRLNRFNQFVMRDIANQLKILEDAIKREIDSVRRLTFPDLSACPELEQLIPGFGDEYAKFCQIACDAKELVSNYLHDGESLNIPHSKISHILYERVALIELQIKENVQFLQDKSAIKVEHEELMAREHLFLNKEKVVRYIDEFHHKNWLRECQSLLNTATVSRKIGDLIAEQAVSYQHREFIKHLTFFNQELASKVLISKTRTSQGSTFQQCKLTKLSDSIESVLSEGEQKIVALSNFLAECTIDNRLNSIVFDDPVNSLDMKYREKIAKKIAELSLNRQVIVFTHDLYFLRLLMDQYSDDLQEKCEVIGIEKESGITGLVTDEIPYLAKNVQERINSILRVMAEYDLCDVTDRYSREAKLSLACKKMRFMLERTIEEVLSSKTYERFSKNIHVKKSNLASYVITEKSDIDFILKLFSKYSLTLHDGGIVTINQLPLKDEILSDIREYSQWKLAFIERLKAWRKANNCS